MWQTTSFSGLPGIVRGWVSGSVTRRSLRRCPPKLTDKRRSLKRKENWLKLLLLGIQTGNKLAKPPFFVAYSRLCRHCRNFAEGGCLLSPFHFTLCACRNLPCRASLYQMTLLVLRGFLNVTKSSVVFPQLYVLLLTLLQVLVRYADWAKLLKRRKWYRNGHPLRAHNFRINKTHSEERSVF